jgi:arabinofuranosyltransferase
MFTPGEPGDEERNHRLPMSPWGIAIGIGVAVGFLLHARAWSFLCDDAYISFRYAVNLAEHGQLVFNPGIEPPEYVEGYTNFLWVLVLAAGAFVGLPPHVLAPWLTWLSAFAGLVLVMLLVRRLRRAIGDPNAQGAIVGVDLIPAALLVASPEYMVWQSGGLETSFVVALGVGAMLAWVRERRIWAAALAAAAGLTRLDALLPLALFGLAWLAVFVAPRFRGPGGRRPKPQRRQLLVALAVFVVPLLAHFLWRRAYYGAWLPNTWAIKAHGATLRATEGNAYVLAWAEAVGVLYVAPLAVLLRPRHLTLLVPLAGSVYYAWWVGGDFIAYGRLLLPATVMLAALVGWLLADAGRLLGWRAPKPVAALAPYVLGLALCAALAVATHARWRLDRSKPRGWVSGRWEGVTAMSRFALVRVVVGRWMRDNLPPDTLITVGAAGALPYASGLPTIDAFGLSDPVIVRHPEMRPSPKGRPGHQVWAPRSYIEQRDPDLLCHVGHHGEKLPRAARKGFRRGYTWACVGPEETAEIAASVGLTWAGYYCCRRPVDRVVGPFGGKEAP